MYCNDLYEAIDLFNKCEGARTYFSDLSKSLEHNNIVHIPGGINNANNPKIHRQSIEYILSNSKKHSDKPLIIFDWVGEAYVISYIELMHSIVQELVEKHDYTMDQFLYFTGAAHSNDNIKKYRRLQSMFRYLPYRVGYVNHWEYYQAEDLKKSSLGQVKQIVSKDKKKFLSFNNQPRPHRLALLSLLANKNLLDNSYISANAFRNIDINAVVPKLFPKLCKEIQHGYDKIKDKLPINLTLSKDNDNLNTIAPVDTEVFTNSLFSLVTETIYTGRIDQIKNSSHITSSITFYPCMFITEKTFKPIRAEHPFIVVSTPYVLAHLRDLGYKTFSPFIDETYDTIENPELRMVAIVNEVERLSNLKGKELIKWQKDIKEITTYNFNRLLNTKSVVHYEDVL